MNTRKTQNGFTLLEVIIAISILGVALGAILVSQSGSIHHTMKSKELNIATWLAQKTMVESEHLLEGKPFSEVEKEKIEAFPPPFDQYSWKREVTEIKFPDWAQAAAGNSSKPGEGPTEAARILSKVFTKFLNNAIRELVVTVTWKSAGREQKISISTYLVDFNAEFDFSI